MAVSKRSLLTGGLALVAGYGLLRFGIPAIGAALSGGFQFEDLPRPSGFRRISRGKSSVGINPLFGVDGDHGPDMQAVIRQVEKDVCTALFGPGQPAEDTVRIASFSDYNCPYCRKLTPMLARLEDESDGKVKLTWHELPLLGDLSVLASKAAIAAGRQGAYVEFHTRLMRAAFLKTPEYIGRLARDMGIDGDQLAEDMQSSAVAAQIRQSIALSQVFGIIGTPALVVGSTLVLGQIDENALVRLIDRERADGPNRGCR